MLPIWTLHFPFFFEIMKNENRKSKIRQVLFLFNLLIASADTPIPTEYNIPELQIMFDEILTVVGHNSGQNWKDYHFPAELNLPWAQVNCRTEEITYSSEYVAEISLQMTCLRAFFPFKKEKLFAVTSYRLAYHFSYKYNHRKLYLHHNIPARQLHLRTKTGFWKKNT